MRRTRAVSKASSLTTVISGLLAAAAIAGTSCATAVVASAGSPTGSHAPDRTPATLPPAGQWQVELSAEDLIAAGAQPDSAGGVFTWTFDGDHATISVRNPDGSLEAECRGRMSPIKDRVRLRFHGGACGDEVDEIRWRLEPDGLYLSLAKTNGGEAYNRAYLEAKPWQAVGVASPSVGESPSPAGPAGATLHYVALGDSWPEGAHCGGCRTFVDRWADSIREATGRPVALTDLTGSREPGLAPGSGETTSSLLASLRFNPEMRDAIRSADIILISSGSNDIGLLDEPPAGGDCEGEARSGCIEALGREVEVDLDAALDEIELLRAGKPTAIRLTNDANLTLADPASSWPRAEVAAWDKVFQRLTDAKCQAAAAHHAVCVDVRPIINGPTMDEPGDENADSTMQGIADALMATGLPELAP